MSFFVIKFVNLNHLNIYIFRIGIFKVLNKGKFSLMGSIGFYFRNLSKKLIVINTRILGSWLNKGAFLKPNVLKLFRKFVFKF